MHLVVEKEGERWLYRLTKIEIRHSGDDGAIVGEEDEKRRKIKYLVSAPVVLSSFLSNLTSNRSDDA